LFGVSVAEAVLLLHLLVTKRATHATYDDVVEKLLPRLRSEQRTAVGAAYAALRGKLRNVPNVAELSTLVRAYFRTYPGVPLSTLCAETKLTERRLECLLPLNATGKRYRRAEWSALFMKSPCATIWDRLRNPG
jgi:hypothetical protein